MLRSSLFCLFFIAGLSFCYIGRAQSVLQVVGAAGGSSKALSGYSIDFTVGETVIATAGTDPTCTEGFHQPLTARDFPDSNLINAKWYIKVFPNPVHDQLTIHTYMDQPGNLDLRLIDIMGRVVLTRRLAVVQGYNDVLLNMGSLARGIFVLYMTDAHGGHKTFKLLKE